MSIPDDHVNRFEQGMQYMAQSFHSAVEKFGRDVYPNLTLSQKMRVQAVVDQLIASLKDMSGIWEVESDE